ncbi:MAG: hypothetical protein JNJ54_06895 [Myxococcaceae bacterium]|nr:hypothetical protein [Myxococcaceae bacterium]
MKRAVAVGLLLVASVVVAGPKKKTPPKAPAPKPAYVSLATVVDETKTPEAKALAEAALKAALAKWQAISVAPAGESGTDAKKVLSAKKAVGLELSLTLRGGKGDQLDAALVVSSYPEHALKSEYRAGGGGGPVAVLVEPVIEQLIGDLAKDQGWSPAAR